MRLLAHEIWKRSNDSCVPCLLLTGEERRSAYAPGTDVQETLSEAEDDELQPLLGKAHADHVACTVEMMSTTNFVDVAVIDEIQMLGDPDRGWAWTQAILGMLLGIMA